MGVESDPMAVVSPQLKVYGTKNLRVVDASIMPVIVGKYPSAKTTKSSRTYVCTHSRDCRKSRRNDFEGFGVMRASSS